MVVNNPLIYFLGKEVALACVPLPRNNSSPLKIRYFPKGNGWSSNHPFSGAFAVSSRDCIALIWSYHIIWSFIINMLIKYTHRIHLWVYLDPYIYIFSWSFFVGANLCVPYMEYQKPWNFRAYRGKPWSTSHQCPDPLEARSFEYRWNTLLIWNCPNKGNHPKAGEPWNNQKSPKNEPWGSWVNGWKTGLPKKEVCKPRCLCCCFMFFPIVFGLETPMNWICVYPRWTHAWSCMFVVRQLYDIIFCGKT